MREIEKRLKKLIKNMNDRLYKMQKNKLPSRALDYLKSELPERYQLLHVTKSGYIQFNQSLKNMTFNDLQHYEKILNRFKQAKTSTVRGAKKYYRELEEQLKNEMGEEGYKNRENIFNSAWFEYAKKNLQAAKEAGLKIGAYFFSQALDIKETDEEIQFMLNMLADVDLDMPLVLDWEIPAEDARTKNMDARTLTDIQLHFCGQMKKMGYQPMVYFNWHQSENLYYLSELEDYPFWLALYQDRMTYPWKVEMWQWTSSGKVPGIQGNVDINVFMPH